MIYSLNVEAFKFHPYDISDINKAMKYFGVSIIEETGSYYVERNDLRKSISDGDFIVIFPSPVLVKPFGLPIHKFDVYTNDRFMNLVKMNKELKELTDKIFSYNPKEDSRDPVFGKHNIKKNEKKENG